MSLFDEASLIITPNAYEEGKIFAIKPTDGSGDLSVVRATTATDVNSAGLIEDTPYNLVQRSEQFENASWSKTNAIITANATTAPNGSLTADKLVENNLNGVHIILQSLTLNVGTTYTVSCFLKAGERNRGRLRVLGTSAQEVEFNLQNGTSNGGVIQDFGNEWYRISFTFVANGASSSIVIFLSDSTTGNSFFNYTYTGNGTSGFFIWGAQIVTGTSAREYFPTTDRLNVPRLDYTNSTCPSILVEPQRTNLLLRSQELDSALVWFPIAATVAANNTTAPDGTVSADKVIATAASSTHLIIQQPAGSVNGTTSTVSIFAKSAGLSRIQFVNNAGGLGIANYNLSTGTATLVNGVSASIQDYGNGWYRCIMTYTPTNTGNFNIQIRLADNSGNTTFLGNGVDGVSLWGAQAEAGSNATSYIPTVASTVTRNADVISKTGISSLIGQTEGTIFTEFNFTNVGTADKYIVNLKDIAGSNVISFRRLTSGEIRFVLTATTSSGTTNQSTAVLPNGNYKIAYKYISGSIKIFINGSLSITLTPTFTFGTPISIIELGNQNVTAQINDSIKQLQLYKTALTDTECINLTTL
jgi:hypothetical protein